MAQIVADFEGAAINSTSFMAGGVEWNLTGDLQISEFENFSCEGSSGSNKYIDSGYQLGGPSEGVIGSIEPLDAAVTFQVATSTAQCV